MRLFRVPVPPTVMFFPAAAVPIQICNRLALKITAEIPFGILNCPVRFKLLSELPRNSLGSSNMSDSTSAPADGREPAGQKSAAEVVVVKRSRLVASNSLLSLLPPRPANASIDRGGSISGNTNESWRSSFGSDQGSRRSSGASASASASVSASGSGSQESGSEYGEGEEYYEYSDEMDFSNDDGEGDEGFYRGGGRYYQDKWSKFKPGPAHSQQDRRNSQSYATHDSNSHRESLDNGDGSISTDEEQELGEYFDQQELWNREGILCAPKAVADLHTDSAHASARPLFLPEPEEIDDDEEEVAAHSQGGSEALVKAGAEFDKLKQLRLQRLLSRTDRIVESVHGNMQFYVAQQKEKEEREATLLQLQEAAATASAEAETKGKSKKGAKAKASKAVAAAAAAAVIAATSGSLDAKISGNADKGAGPNPSAFSSSRYLRGRTLRDYQLGGLEWLLSLHSQGLNGILADEMGLGKTLIVLSLLAALWERNGLWGPHLVVVPMSVLSSWKDELSRFLPGFFDVYIHHGAKEQRREDFVAWRKATLAAKLSKQRAAAAAGTTTLGSLLGPSGGTSSSAARAWPKGVPFFQVSLFFTTYDIAIKDCSLLQKLGRGQLRWQYLVVDEAHRLKNRSSVLFESLGKTHAARRLLLTGTPLQNNLGELWALLSFVLPAIFNDIQQYADWFNRPFQMEDEEAEEEAQGGGEASSQLSHGADADGNVKVEKSSGKSSKSKRRSISGKNSAKGRKSGKPTTTTIENALSTEERALIVTSIQRIIKPFLLRRLKVDVISELPRKVERTVVCPMSGLQRSVYEVIRRSVEDAEFGPAAPTAAPTDENKIPSDSRSSGRVSEGNGASRSAKEADKSNKIFASGVSFNNVLMHLRKLCNHPFLVLEDMATIPDELYYK